MRRRQTVMGIDPNAGPSITLDQIEIWLKGLVAGVIDLSRDNEGMAAATLAYLSRPPAPWPIPPPLPAGYLTPHFTLAEFVDSDTARLDHIDNSPDADEVDEIAETAELMELVRARCGGKPVLISSGFRCPELNMAVGGADNSAHLYGCAVDFTIPGFGTPLEVCRAIEPHVAEWKIDQLIYEVGWVHLGRAIPPSTPRAQVFTITNDGTSQGLVA